MNGNTDDAKFYFRTTITPRGQSGDVAVWTARNGFSFKIPGIMDDAEMEGVEETTVPSTDEPPHGSDNGNQWVVPVVATFRFSLPTHTHTRIYL